MHSLHDRYYPDTALERFTSAVFEAHGLPAQDAAILAHNLVDANLRGLDTHGVARIKSYVSRIENGLVNVTPEFTHEFRMPWAAAIDADNAMGAVAGNHAMKTVLKSASEMGIGAATVRHSNHFGAAGYFARMAIPHDCIGLSLAPASKSLAPYGSREPLFGTNPIAAAVPAGQYAPWVMDMASSVAARGHIRLAEQQGKEIPAGWALDSHGAPTTSAREAMQGVMVPFSGPKGSAIAMFVDILGGVLSGSGFAGTIRDMNKDFTTPQNVGHFFLAIKVEAFMPLAEFHSRMEEQIERIHRLQPGTNFSSVMYPGEPEDRTSNERRKTGIPLNTEVLATLNNIGQSVGVQPPDPFNKQEDKG